MQNSLLSAGWNIQALEVKSFFGSNGRQFGIKGEYFHKLLHNPCLCETLANLFFYVIQILSFNPVMPQEVLGKISGLGITRGI